jgi:dCMP deaminase
LTADPAILVEISFIMSDSRPEWDEIWMEMAHSIARRSYDPKYKVGAIIVSADNTSVLALGYNGNFAGGPN